MPKCVSCGLVKNDIVTSLKHPLCSDCAKNPKMYKRYLNSLKKNHPDLFAIFSMELADDTDVHPCSKPRLEKPLDRYRMKDE